MCINFFGGSCIYVVRTFFTWQSENFPKDSVLSAEIPPSEVFYKVCTYFLNAFYMKSILEMCNVTITSYDQKTSPGITQSSKNDTLVSILWNLSFSWRLLWSTRLHLCSSHRRSRLSRNLCNCLPNYTMSWHNTRTSTFVTLSFLFIPYIPSSSPY